MSIVHIVTSLRRTWHMVVINAQLNSSLTTATKLHLTSFRSLTTMTTLPTLFIVSLGAIFSVDALVACNETSTCEKALRVGSECVEGSCTNPFSKGCLNAVLGEGYTKIRTCNSQDKPGTICSPSPLNYQEVRIAPANWESSMMYAWVVQILLSETLDVPTSIELNKTGELNFYDTNNGFTYPAIANNLNALYKANEVGDCLRTDEPCAHFLPEVWQGKRELNESAVEREGNGMVGHVAWYIPLFAAQQEASLTNYLGLAGEENRQKLASTFKRPLRFVDYCTKISSNNCTTDDGIASRFPSDDTEAKKYFVKDVYTGHFIHTEENNCTANPNCTGHMIDYPCTWSAYTAAQLFWNDIPLDTDPYNGTSYTYGDILQIMEASNATKSPIVLLWYYPDPLPDIWQYVQVALPKTTRECLENRPDPKDRCTASIEDLLGKEVGSCGYNTHTLQKYFANSFRELSVDIPLARRSPGHQLVRNIQLSDIDMSKIMVDWVNRGVDKWNYDPREAVCTWVADNYEHGMKLKQFLPPGYPRLIEEEAGYNTALTYFCIAFGVFGSIVSAVAGGAAYHFRLKKQIKCAQEIFLYLFSLGFFFVGIGASLYATVPSLGSCVAREWFYGIGFTLAFVPLLIKICAINKLMNDSKKCRKTNVSRESVLKIVGAIVMVVVLYLSIWTGVDAPSSESELVLREENGNHVDVYIQCSSEHKVWRGIAFASEGAVIFCTAAVAYISRNVPQAFNESKVVGNVAYASFFFFVFKFLVAALPNSVLSPSLKNALTSLLLTLQSLVVIAIYFGVKFYSIYKHEDAHVRDSGFNPRSSCASDAGMSQVTQSEINTYMRKFSSGGNEDIVCPSCNRVMPDTITSSKSASIPHDAVITVHETSLDTVSGVDKGGVDGGASFPHDGVKTVHETCLDTVSGVDKGGVDGGASMPHDGVITVHETSLDTVSGVDKGGVDGVYEVSAVVEKEEMSLAKSCQMDAPNESKEVLEAQIDGLTGHIEMLEKKEGGA